MDQARTGSRILNERRSYDADEVDAFLHRVRVGVTRLKKERQAAVDRAAAAERRAEEQATALGQRVVRMQEALDAALADARREADDLIAEARARADRMLVAAEAKAQDVVAAGAERRRRARTEVSTTENPPVAPPLRTGPDVDATAVVVASGPAGHQAPWTLRPPGHDEPGDNFFAELGRSLAQDDRGHGVGRQMAGVGEVMSDALCRSCFGTHPDDDGLCIWCGGWPGEAPPKGPTFAERFRRAAARPRAPVAAVGVGSLLTRRR